MTLCVCVLAWRNASLRNQSRDYRRQKFSATGRPRQVIVARRPKYRHRHRTAIRKHEHAHLIRRAEVGFRQ
jgi:hypothetical protein